MNKEETVKIVKVLKEGQYIMKDGRQWLFVTNPEEKETKLSVRISGSPYSIYAPFEGNRKWLQPLIDCGFLEAEDEPKAEVNIEDWLAKKVGDRFARGSREYFEAIIANKDSAQKLTWEVDGVVALRILCRVLYGENKGEQHPNRVVERMKDRMSLAMCHGHVSTLVERLVFFQKSMVERLATGYWSTSV